MLTRTLIAVSLLGLFVAPASLAESADLPEHLDGLDDHVLAAMRTMELPGLSLALVDESGVVVAKGYGVREIGSPDRVDENTLFEIGSVTKTFTATAVGILVENGDLDWTTRIREHIPYFELDDPYVSDAFTVADALSHRGGYSDSYYYDHALEMSRTELIQRLKYEKPVMPFRSGFEYHNAIFTAAAEMIPILTGDSWHTYVDEQILRPLGMVQTMVVPDGIENRANVAAPHVLTTDGMKSFTRRVGEPDVMPEAGSMVSNASDMARWCQFQLGHDSVGKAAPVGGDTLNQMRTQYSSGTFSWFHKWGYGNVRAGYGLGWKLFDYRGDADQLVAHGGSMDGVQSWMAFSPKNKYCIAMMTNGDWSGDAAHFAIANWIQDRYLGLEQKDWISDLLEAERESMVQIVQRRASDKGKNTNIPLSQPAPAYVGEYTSPSYGELTVTMRGTDFEVQLGQYVAIAEHWRGEIFLLNWGRPGVVNPYLTFDVSHRGDVTGLSLHWAGDEFAFSRILSQYGVSD